MSSSQSQKTRNVLTKPEPGTTVAPAHNYSEEQLAQMEALRQYARSISLPEDDPYHPWELRWLQKPDTIPRYMRAAKWNFTDAQKRIKATIEWRREYKPDLIPPNEVKIESETGKIIITGFDRDGRPIIYMRPGRENTETSPRQLRHLVWCLERAKDLMPPGQESLVIIVDYKSTTLRTNPSISVARKVLHILQQHYVETLGRALVVNLPMLLNFFYKGISPFLDPITRDKMRFNPNLVELIPESHLDADFGGSYHFEFEPESYWNQIVTACGIAPDGTRVVSPEASSPSLSTSSTSLSASSSTPATEDSTKSSPNTPSTPFSSDTSLLSSEEQGVATTTNTASTSSSSSSTSEGKTLTVLQTNDGPENSNGEKFTDADGIQTGVQPHLAPSNALIT